jgi:(p)ppGpp synthase/HD superfamily hydrolase
MVYIPAETTQTPPAAVHQVHLPAAWEHCGSILDTLYPNNTEVSESYALFLASLQQAYQDGSLSADDMVRILKGIEFSAEKHKSQTRKNSQKSPYIIHPIGVAHHLMIVGNVRDADILIGALLHDTVEDTNASFEEIQAKFGLTVEGLVRETTDDKSLPKAVRKQLQIEHASHKSPGAAMIKLADKFYNLTDMTRETPTGEDGEPWTQERIDTYFAWAKQVIDALPPVNTELKAAVDQLIAEYQASP